MTQKIIDVQQQPVLSLRRTTRIALAGVRYRLFRAMVTVAVIAIAMAFLTNILSESLIKGAVATSARQGIADLRRVDSWIARLSVPQSPEESIAALAGLDPSQSSSVMTSWTEEQLSPCLQTAAEAHIYLSFFHDLNYGRKRGLVGSTDGTLIFDLLQGDEAQRRFFPQLSGMRSVRFPTTDDAFRTFLSRWPVLQELVTDIRATQHSAIQKVATHLGDEPLLIWLCEVDRDFGEIVRTAGFTLSPEDARDLATRARTTAQAQLIEGSISRLEVRQEIAARKDLLPSDVTPDLLWNLLRDARQASWFLERLEELGIDHGSLDGATAAALARDKAQERLLTEADRATVDAGGGFMGLGTRMTWLAFVSMLVCVVGIANAMLMSVTERFREIATLKCLGALDGFIMTVFLIEAAILGLAGGLLGSCAGAILGVGRMLFRFKSLMVHSLPLGALLLAMLISVALGVLLAAAAAVYPSFRAARLAPMEAMRIE